MTDSDKSATKRDDARRQFRTKAFRVFSQLGIRELLEPLTAQRMTAKVDNDGHVNRHQLYKVTGYSKEGRDDFVRDFVVEATRATSKATTATLEDVQRVLGGLAAGDRRMVRNLHSIAGDNIKSYFNDDGERQRDAVRMLIAISSADADDVGAKTALHGYYKELNTQLSAMYDGILTALDRRPIERLGEDSSELTVVLTALADGLVFRRLADEDVFAERLFSDVIIPVFMALTTPNANPTDPSDEDRVFPRSGHPGTL